MSSISLVSINIELSKHFELVVPFLSGRMPDVVCVQELFEKDIPMLAEALGGAVCVFAPMTRQDDLQGGRAVTGVGLFSRLPIREKKILYYHGDPARIHDFDFTDAETKSKTENYAVVFCDVEKDGSLFKIGTTHFTWTSDGSASDGQRADMRQLLDLLGFEGGFTLAGDFNAPRGGEIFSMISDRYHDNIPAAYTTSIDGSLHRAGPLPYMVDGLFSTPDYEASDVALISGVSDHCAIVATISHFV